MTVAMMRFLANMFLNWRHGPNRNRVLRECVVCVWVGVGVSVWVRDATM